MARDFYNGAEKAEAVGKQGEDNQRRSILPPDLTRLHRLGYACRRCVCGGSVTSTDARKSHARCFGVSDVCRTGVPKKAELSGRRGSVKIKEVCSALDLPAVIGRLSAL